MAEKSNLASIMRAMGRLTGRLYRNNVGVFTAGTAVRVATPTSVTMYPGDVLVRKARQVRCGLRPGSGDGIGWQTVEITPAMVGRRLAVFVSVEAKTMKGRAAVEQIAWRDRVLAAGGFACVARSGDEALAAFHEWVDAVRK